MIQIGLVVVTLGIVGVIWGIFQRLKAGRVADAPLAKTGDAAARGAEVAGPKGALSVQGKVHCAQPLVAPFSGIPCLYYSIKCTARWKDGDTTKTKEIEHRKVAAEVFVDDGSGRVRLDLSEGGDFEPSQTKEETKGTGLLGGIAGGEIAFGQYVVSTGMLSLGTKYTVREEVLPVVPELYACGRTKDGAVGSPDWRQLIVSNKTRDELLAAATTGAKRFLLGGGAAVAAGSVLALVGQLTAG
jgi:hypothetical protein